VTPRQAATILILLLGLSAIVVLVLSEWVVTPWVVAGESMRPTLRAGDRVLVDRWTYGRRGPRVGEVVLLEGPSTVPMIKRVARFPGKTRDVVWVVGDNARDSEDSRTFGPLPVERVRGRVVCRYWPPSRVGEVPALEPETPPPVR